MGIPVLCGQHQVIQRREIQIVRDAVLTGFQCSTRDGPDEVIHIPRFTVFQHGAFRSRIRVIADFQCRIHGKCGSLMRQGIDTAPADSEFMQHQDLLEVVHRTVGILDQGVNQCRTSGSILPGLPPFVFGLKHLVPYVLCHFRGTLHTGVHAQPLPFRIGHRVCRIHHVPEVRDDLRRVCIDLLGIRACEHAVEDCANVRRNVLGNRGTLEVPIDLTHEVLDPLEHVEQFRTRGDPIVEIPFPPLRVSFFRGFTPLVPPGVRVFAQSVRHGVGVLLHVSGTIGTQELLVDHMPELVNEGREVRGLQCADEILPGFREMLNRATGQTAFGGLE